MNAFTDVGTFLIQSLATIYLVVILLRFLLQLCGANFYNPVSQFAHKATLPLLAPLRKLFPAYGKLDFASLILALLLQWLAIQLTASLNGNALINVLYVLWWGVLGIISMLINIYIYGLLAAIILSWVAPNNQHPVVTLLWQLMEPVMAPFRKLLPNLGGLDLSPILVFLVLNMFRIFVTHAANASQLPGWAVPGF
ncbi:MAG: membrane protein [Gammaproteobacteria bacterium BRH_c0]|nr:MAG: membrane protein [Gammaproteobacteria bacterium BRH_c0]